MVGIAQGFQLGAACLPVDALWADGDGEWALSAFLEEWAVGFLLMLVGVGVDELHIAGAEYLETVVEIRAGGQRLGAEAGTGIVNFEKTKRLVGVIAYGGFDVGRVAAGEAEDGEKREGAERTHEELGYQEVKGGRTVQA